MTKRELDKPEFLVGLRGDDRQQVDDYVDRLRAVASEAKEKVLLADLRRLQSALQTVASLIGKREDATAMLPVLRRADDPRPAETDERSPMPVPAEVSEQTPADHDAPESSSEWPAAGLCPRSACRGRGVTDRLAVARRLDDVPMA